MKIDGKQIAVLVNELRNGNKQAFEKLYAATYKKLYVYALYLSDNEHDAQDNMQNAYIKAVENIRQLKEPEKFYRWIRQILHNLTMDEYRRREREAVPQSSVGSDDMDIIDMKKEKNEELLPEEKIGRDELRKIITEVMNELSKGQRAAMLAFYMDDMEISDIAEMLGCSEGTVKSRLYYGREAFREKIEHYEKKHSVKLHSIAPFMLIGFKDLEDSMAPAVSDSVRIFKNIESAAEMKYAGYGTSFQAAGSHGAKTAAVKAGKAAAGISAKKIAAIVLIAAVAFGGSMFGYNHYKHQKAEKARIRTEQQKKAEKKKEEKEKRSLEKQWKSAYADFLGQKIRNTNSIDFRAVVKDINSDSIPEVMIAGDIQGRKLEMYTYSPKTKAVEQMQVKNDAPTNSRGAVKVNSNGSFIRIKSEDDLVGSKGSGSEYSFSLKDNEFKEDTSNEDQGSMENLEMSSFNNKDSLIDYLEDKLGITINAELTSGEMENILPGTWQASDSAASLIFNEDGTCEFHEGFSDTTYALSGAPGNLVMTIKGKAYNENNPDESVVMHYNVDYRNGNLILTDSETGDETTYRKQ